MKRGQASMEFLMVYGWAILAAVIVVAALAYYGVFSPGKSLPSLCSISPPLGCSEYKVSDDGVRVVVINGAGESISITNFSVIDCGSDDSVISLPDGGMRDFVIYCSPGDSGDKFSGEIEITYNLVGKQISKKVSGEIASEIRSTTVGLPPCDDFDGDGSCVFNDCDNNNDTIYPGAVEDCYDGVDNDCDNNIDSCTCGTLEWVQPLSVSCSSEEAPGFFCCYCINAIDWPLNSGGVDYWNVSHWKGNVGAAAYDNLTADFGIQKCIKAVSIMSTVSGNATKVYVFNDTSNPGSPFISFYPPGVPWNSSTLKWNNFSLSPSPIIGRYSMVSQTHITEADRPNIIEIRFLVADYS